MVMVVWKLGNVCSVVGWGNVCSGVSEIRSFIADMFVQNGSKHSCNTNKLTINNINDSCNNLLTAAAFLLHHTQ